MFRTLGLAVMVGLAACSASGEITEEDGVVVEVKPAAAKARFAGAKLAPPAETMNYWAGMGAVEAQGYTRSKGMRDKGCESKELFKTWTSGEDANPDCIADMEALAKTAVFSPAECREGPEEGLPRNGPVSDAVTCRGQLETSFGSGTVDAVYHKAGGEWFGYIVKPANWEGEWLGRR